MKEWTKTSLWEYGRRKLGYGNWEEERDGYYQKWSGLEAHKLSLVMKKRNITPEEFILCVDWCQRNHKRIENAVWVFRFINDAKQDWKNAQTAEGLALTVEGAVAYERTLAAPDSANWIARLVRARGQYREDVLAEWRLQRSTQQTQAV